MYKLKVIFIGPSGCGKTTVANFLADATENTSGEYRPTKGVRILQFESSNLNVKNRSVKAEVELWDCSGDHKQFEATWPALQNDTHGVVLMYDPTSVEHVRDLERLFSYFVQQPGLSSKSCLILANPRNAASYVPLSSTLSRVPQATVNIEESGNKLRSDFAIFLTNVLSKMSDTHEQEELHIMSSLNA